VTCDKSGWLPIRHVIYTDTVVTPSAAAAMTPAGLPHQCARELEVAICDLKLGRRRPVHDITRAILILRGGRVILDRDLAALYSGNLQLRSRLVV